MSIIITLPFLVIYLGVCIKLLNVACEIVLTTLAAISVIWSL